MIEAFDKERAGIMIRFFPCGFFKYRYDDNILFIDEFFVIPDMRGKKVAASIWREFLLERLDEHDFEFVQCGVQEGLSGTAKNKMVFKSVGFKELFYNEQQDYTTFEHTRQQGIEWIQSKI